MKKKISKKAEDTGKEVYELISGRDLLAADVIYILSTVGLALMREYDFDSKTRKEFIDTTHDVSLSVNEALEKEGYYNGLYVREVETRKQRKNNRTNSNVSKSKIPRKRGSRD